MWDPAGVALAPQRRPSSLGAAAAAAGASAAAGVSPGTAPPAVMAAAAAVAGTESGRSYKCGGTDLRAKYRDQFAPWSFLPAATLDRSDPVTLLRLPLRTQEQAEANPIWQVRRHLSLRMS